VQTNRQLTLTYSWSTNNHGICGHTFEVIDYYMILKNQYDTEILLCEDISWSTFEKAIRSKYDFDEAEIQDIKVNTRFENRPRLIKGNNIIFTDGGIVNTENVILIFDNIFYFACGNKEIQDNNKDNVYILQDDRIYDSVLKNGINYKKKILFSRLKKPQAPKDNILLYATKNCRAIGDEYYKMLSKNLPCDNILCLVNEIPLEKYSNITFKLLPYNNLIEEFNTYIYTPVARKFDCSPRFIAECHYFSKTVVYDVDYWLEDKGLFWRRYDIENNFSSIQLNQNDEIVNILKERI